VLRLHLHPDSSRDLPGVPRLVDISSEYAARARPSKARKVESIGTSRVITCRKCLVTLCKSLGPYSYDIILPCSQVGTAWLGCHGMAFARRLIIVCHAIESTGGPAGSLSLYTKEPFVSHTAGFNH